ncbi:putative carboxylesterase 15 [Ananas comosus]|uniref:Putative carboxylesterase 15 n=1 Tax=Ananas comosus TaxID=4615 RepID=A0A199V8Z9_ANACO|nr:putative carboxylesterase 15 [Ananas comosus]
MSSSSSSPPPHVVEDCRGVVQLLSDGTVRRSPDPIFPVDSDGDDGSVGWKDLGVLVVSADYRLAPEHRLPAAIEDGATALLWLKSQAEAGARADPWLAESADFSVVFVSGDSAGGNIAHHMAVRFGPAGLNPVRIRGFIILMPAFGGVDRTRSELECPADAFLNLEVADRYCRLMLPRGATRDHPLFNPFGPESPIPGPFETGPVLVVAAERDLLRDRHAEYAAKMRELGKPVELVEIQGQEHGFFATKPWSEPAGELVRIIKRFMDEFRSDSA